MPEKKELNQEDLEKVSGGLMKDTDDDLEEDEQTISKSVDGDCSKESIKESNARPNR